jgi:ABC-type transport system substrate-binding protein
MRSTRERADAPRVAALARAVTSTLAIVRVVASTLAIALASAACSNELPAPIRATHGPDAEPQRGGVLELATFGDLRSLDPATISDGLSPQILEQLFAGLVDYDDEGHIEPDIAERWEVADEGKTYRFFLRQGVRFHDGDEVTAADVKRSVERALHRSTPNSNATYYKSIVGFADFADNSGTAETLSGVEVEGRYVVSLHLEHPDATFLRMLAMLVLRPVCKSGGARYSDTWLPCGAGPFKLRPDGWQRAHTLTVVRHDAYYRPGLPYLDGVRWTLHENQNSQRYKFLRGDLDVLRDFISPDLLRFQADARWKPFATIDEGHQIIGDAMNVEMPPFDNIEIRRAVAAAVDRDALRKVRAGSLQVANQLVPPGVFGYDPSLPGQRSDHAAALEHMRRAGYPYDPVTKTGGWPHVIPYVVYKQGLQEFTAQVLAQQLEKIGLRIEIRVVNYPTFIALRGRRKTSPFGPGFWAQDFPDALSFLEPMFHSRSIAPEDSNNWSFYSNPRVDELIDRAHRELDDGRRKALYDETQEILAQDAPWSFNLNFNYYTQRQGYVHGHRTHPMWMNDVTRAWIDRAAGPVASRAIFSSKGLAALLGTDDVDRPRPLARNAAGGDRR